MKGWLKMENIDYKLTAEKLWNLLDDIDTAEDIAKDDDKLFRQLARKAYKRRLLYAESEDGYGLTFKLLKEEEPKETRLFSEMTTEECMVTIKKKYIYLDNYTKEQINEIYANTITSTTEENYLPPYLIVISKEKEHIELGITIEEYNSWVESKEKIGETFPFIEMTTEG
jgi:hypothetical protein